MINPVAHTIKLWLLIGLILLSIKGNCQQKKKASTTKNIPAKSKASLASPVSPAQLSTEEESEYKQKIYRLVSFLEFALNTIGSDSTSAQDKEVIINKSFLKFFKDAKVQIEDDLDDKRITPIYKNVQSYLQDVDYFFTQAKFELNIDEITTKTGDDKNIYFIVGLTRYLTSATVNGDSVKNSKKRFVEINLDQKEKDLKIASIYSTSYNEARDIADWWKALPAHWQAVFQHQMGNADTIHSGQLTRLLNTQELLLSADTALLNLEPLSRLVNLKKLDVSYTNINDLTPIRNLVYLEDLNLAGTSVENLNALKYLTNLRIFNIANTPVKDISACKYFKNLETIDLKKTRVTDISPLINNTNLKQIDAAYTAIVAIDTLSVLKKISSLNLAGTLITQISPLASFQDLIWVDISDTKVSDVSPLSKSSHLQTLVANNTSISDLTNLYEVATLKKLSLEGVLFPKSEAVNFVAKRPGAVVVYKTSELQRWWNSLIPDWKEIFRSQLPVDSTPNPDQLAALSYITDIDLGSKKNINTIEPLSICFNLIKVNLNNTSIQSLSPLRDKSFLEELELAGTMVAGLEELDSLKKLKRLNLDETPVSESAVNAFRQRHPDCLIIYQSATLQNWWKNLPEEWKSIYKKYQPYQDEPDQAQLHQIHGLDSITIENERSIHELQSLSMLSNLRYLKVSSANIQSLDPVSNALALTYLDVGNNPIQKLDPLKNLVNLTHLNVENTAIENLVPIANLRLLDELHLAGTNIRDLKPVKNLHNLKILDFSGTNVNTLKAITNLSQIERMKCNNTKLSAKQVDKYKKSHPKCDVTFY